MSKVITISSGKGGVGKTSCSINLAIAYAKLGKRVILLDADLGLANINIMLGVVPKYNLLHLVRGDVELSDIIYDTKYGIKIISGATGFEELANMDLYNRNYLIEQFKSITNYDIFIIDTSAGVSKDVLSFVDASDTPIIITTPEPTAIADAYGLIKMLSQINKKIKLKLIVNRVKNAIEGKNTAYNIVSVAKQFLSVDVIYIGFIYDDDVVRNAIIKQKPFIVSNPNSKPSICINHIVSTIENNNDEVKGGISKFFSKIFN